MKCQLFENIRHTKQTNSNIKTHQFFPKYSLLHNETKRISIITKHNLNSLKCDFSKTLHTKYTEISH